MKKKMLLVISLACAVAFGCGRKQKSESAPAPADMAEPKAPEPSMTADATPVMDAPKPEPAMTADATPAGTAAVAPVEVPPDAAEAETPIWHKTFALDGKKYFLLDSSKLKETKDIKGYEAPLQVWAIFDEAGTLVRVKIVSHKETPEFIERVEKEWLPKFAGLTKDRVILGKGGIDALSEATLSTDAIRKTVDGLRKAAFEQLLKLPLPVAEPEKPVENR